MASGLSQAIVRDPLTIAPDMLLVDAIALMSQTQSSCAIALEQQRILGILTERDIVRIAASGNPIENVAATTVMNRDVVTCLESDVQDLLSVLSLLRQHQIRHLPVVDRQNHLVGMITARSLREALTPAHLLRLRAVNEVMTMPAITKTLTSHQTSKRKWSRCS